MNTPTDNNTASKLDEPMVYETMPLTAKELKFRAKRRWRRFATVQDVAEVLALAAGILLGYAIVFRLPEQLLISGAHGGSPRHWVLGAAVIVLLIASYSGARDVIYSGTTTEPARIRWSSHWPHMVLAVLLLWPLSPELIAAWKANDPAALPVLGETVMDHLAPTVFLVALHIVIAGLLNLIRRDIEKKEEIDEMLRDDLALDSQAEVLEIVRAGTSRANDIARIARVSRPSVRNALDVLSRSGRIRKTGRGIYEAVQQDA